MALATPHPDTAAAPLAGLAARVTARGEVTEVAVRTSQGDVITVELPTVPDPVGARHVSAGYRRLTWQQIDVSGDAVDCRLRGVRHRLPADRPVSLGTALALAAGGLPTVIHVDGAA